MFAGLFVSLLSSLQFYDARVHVGTSVLNDDRQTNQNPYGDEGIHLFLGYANEVTLAGNRHHLRMRGMISLKHKREGYGRSGFKDKSLKDKNIKQYLA